LKKKSRREKLRQIPTIEAVNDEPGLEICSAATEAGQELQM
jgi:hypothetical protein